MKLVKSSVTDSIQEPIIVLHSGGPKCGSSALQTFLTQNSKMKTNSGQKVEYWVAKSENVLKNQFSFYPIDKPKFSAGIKYEISDNFPKKLGISCLHEIFSDFVSKYSQKEKKIFVFSSERWARDFQNADRVECGCEEDFKILNYLSVRPQIDLLIPSYLQWVVWTDTPTLDTAFQFVKGMADWGKQIENAQKLGVDISIVRYTKDIVEDFCTTFEIDRDSIQRLPLERINKTLPLDVIALLLRNRELRPSPHHSNFDYFIEDLLHNLDFKFKRVSLRVEPKLVKEIEVHFQESNLRLMDVLSEEHASAYMAKSTAAGKDLAKGDSVESLFSHEMNPEFMEKLLVSSLLESKNLIDERRSAEYELRIMKLDNAFMKILLLGKIFLKKMLAQRG